MDIVSKIDVLDKGYVRLVDYMGSDLSVVNAARVSFEKESRELNDKDERLIHFLASSQPQHGSPFRHAILTFEIRAPLMTARQWWKYIVGSDHSMDAHNEGSRRYITDTLAFYIPQVDEWRSAPENKKQGSGAPVDDRLGKFMMESLLGYIKEGELFYNTALKAGICAEQARLFLPAYGLYVRWRWTASLQSVCHLIQQRVAHDAQKEFQLYARAVYDITRELFPVSVDALVGDVT